MKEKLIILILCFTALLLVGCGERTEKQNESYYYDEGEDYLNRGRIKKAVINFEKAIRLNPKLTEAYLKLALIYDNIIKDKEKALFYYTEYLKLEPDQSKKREVLRWLEEAKLKKEIPESVWMSPVTEETSDPSKTPTGKGIDEVQLAGIRKEYEENIATLRKSFDNELRNLQNRLKTAKESAETEKNELTKKLNDSAKTIETLSNENENLSTELKQTKDTLEKLQTDYGHLEEKYDSLDNSYKKRLTELETKYDELKKSTTREGRRNLAIELQEAKKSLKELERKNKEYLHSITKMQDDYGKLKTEMNRLEDEIDKLQNENAQLKKEKATLLTSSGLKTETKSVKTVYYKVRQGDTLRSIAERFYGDKEEWKKIYEYNRHKIPNPNNIKVGDRLIIPLEEKSNQN